MAKLRKKLIIVPLALPWNWPSDFERQTILELAKNNLVIAFLANEGITIKAFFTKLASGQKIAMVRKQTKNLFFFTPLFPLPFPRQGIFQKLYNHLSAWQLKCWIAFHAHWRRYPKVLWFFTPQFSYPPHLFGKTYFAFSLYDCVDSTTSMDPQEASVKARAETALAQEVATILTVSPRLFRIQTRNHPQKQVLYLPQGFDRRLFAKKRSGVEPKDLWSIPSPRIGYIGNINFRFNFKLLLELIKALPNVSFVFIGPVDPDQNQDPYANTGFWVRKLKHFRNVYCLDRKPKTAVPTYLTHFDLGIIPYDDAQEFNKSSFPIKLWEYFYAGLPVIALPLTCFDNWKNYLLPFQTGRISALKKAVLNVLDRGWPKHYRLEQKRLASQHSWHTRIVKAQQIIDANL